MDELAVLFVPALILILMALAVYAHVKNSKKLNRRNQHLQRWVRQQDPPPRIVYRQR
jgi:CHASE3 domain sensor protein